MTDAIQGERVRWHQEVRWWREVLCEGDGCNYSARQFSDGLGICTKCGHYWRGEPETPPETGDAERVLELLTAAGLVSAEKIAEARQIACGLTPKLASGNPASVGTS